jgi:hypothetical protein
MNQSLPVSHHSGPLYCPREALTHLYLCYLLPLGNKNHQHLVAVPDVSVALSLSVMTGQTTTR